MQEKWLRLSLVVMVLLPSACRRRPEAPARLTPSVSTSVADTGLSAPCITIDDTNDKELNCVRFLKTKALPGKSISGTVNELQRCTGSQLNAPITLVGHGMVGYLFTGGGTLIDPQDQHIAWLPAHQKMYWETPLKNQLGAGTGRTGLVTLLSCDTGAGTHGAQLLCNMANVLNRPVRARNGLTFCDKRAGITFQEGSDWVRAEPGCVPPAGTPSPSRPLREVASPFTIAGQKIDISQIASVQLRSTITDSGNGWRTLGPNDASQLLQFVEFDKPQKIEGGPLAVPTGRMRLAIRGASFLPLELIVWNDRLLEDARAPGTFFYTMDGFSDFFAFNLR